MSRWAFSCFDTHSQDGVARRKGVDLNFVGSGECERESQGRPGAACPLQRPACACRFCRLRNLSTRNWR
jgi:hypothetical protein